MSKRKTNTLPKTKVSDFGFKNVFKKIERAIEILDKRK